MIGNDGGLDVSYDEGQPGNSSTPFLAQFYAIAADMRRPYYVYGGLQDYGRGATQPNAHPSGIHQR